MENKGKGIAALLIGKMKPEQDEAEGGDEMGKEAAANEFIKAVHSKDAGAVVESFGNLFAIFESQPHEEADHEAAE